MSGHTPGPWSWWDSCSFRRLSAKNDGDVMHAVIQRGDGHPDVHFPNGGYKGPDASLIAAAPDHAAIARALCFGIARWEPFPSASHGEFCIGGMRHVTSLDEFGVPVMTSGMRAAIAAATGEKV